MQVLLYKKAEGLSTPPYKLFLILFRIFQRGAHGVVSLAAEQAVSAPKQRTAVKVKAAIRFMVKPLLKFGWFQNIQFRGRSLIETQKPPQCYTAAGNFKKYFTVRRG